MSKKERTKKSSVKVKDLRAKKNPKGGAYDAYLKVGDIKGEAMDHKSGLAELKSTLGTGMSKNFLNKKF